MCIGFNADVQIKFAEKGGGGVVEVCSLVVTRVGANTPCVSVEQKAEQGAGQAWLDLTVCHADLETDAGESGFQVGCGRYSDIQQILTSFPTRL